MGQKGREGKMKGKEEKEREQKNREKEGCKDLSGSDDTQEMIKILRT